MPTPTALHRSSGSEAWRAVVPRLPEGAEDLSDAAHLGKRSKIRRQEQRRAMAGRPDLLKHLFASAAIATMDQDARAQVSQPSCHQSAHAVCRPGH